MKIIDYIKEKLFKKENENPLSLPQPPHLYDNLVKRKEIDSIIANMPNNLTQIEKAYYIYLELGKLLSESPKFVFSDFHKKHQIYNDEINSNYFGICKSISNLYVRILTDKRVGIEAQCVKQHPGSPVSHVDTLITIDGKHYLCNLISDLSRIKTSRRVNGFAYDIIGNEAQQSSTNYYADLLNSYYGDIDFLLREDIEQMDKKLNYSFFIPQYTSEDERGIYTDDTIELLKKEFNDPELFKKYVLHGRDVEEENILKYKLEYLFENINNITDFNYSDSKKKEINYLENIRYYMKIAQKLFSPNELSRIQAYAITHKNNVKNIMSVIKVKPLNSSNPNEKNLYYMYSNSSKKYYRMYPDDLKYILESKNLYDINIIGTFDKYDPRDIDELEL